MSFPNIPNITPLISVTVGQTIPLLLSSIAFEELALAHIMNAEAEKIQLALGTLESGVTLSPAEVSLADVLEVNSDVQRTLRDVIKKEMLLEFKFENVLDLVSILPSASCVPSTDTFSNSSTITIPTNGPASPYPSIITVSGLDGIITKVTVTLDGFTHTSPAHVDVMLVAPDGKTNTILMSDPDLVNPVTNLTLTFDDAAVNPVPCGAAILTSGTYRPTNCTLFVDIFPAPAPTPDSVVALSNFNGLNPNGTWRLFVVDNAGGEGGTISNGWSITITTTCP